EGLRDRLQDHQVAETLKQVLHEAARGVAGLDDVVDGGEQRGPVAGGEGVDGGVDKREVRDTQQGQRNVVGETLGAGTGDELVQDGERIARGTAASADDQRIDGIVDVHALR